MDELYAALPMEFTRRRDELIKSLRGRGDREAAKQVAALRRPSLPAWAINQLARRDPSAIAELVDVQHSLAHFTSAAELQALSHKRRQTIARLVDRARDLLTEADRPASKATIDRIVATLLAINAPEEEERLRKGRLERELTGGGFREVVGTVPEPEEEPERSLAKKRDVERAEALEVAEARAAEQEAARLREEADRLSHEADRLRDEADQAQGVAEAAERRAQQSETRAGEARAKL